jgi:hypothetical protein
MPHLGKALALLMKGASTAIDLLGCVSNQRAGVARQLLCFVRHLQERPVLLTCRSMTHILGGCASDAIVYKQVIASDPGSSRRGALTNVKYFTRTTSFGS